MKKYKSTSVILTTDKYVFSEIYYSFLLLVHWIRGNLLNICWVSGMFLDDGNTKQMYHLQGLIEREVRDRKKKKKTTPYNFW